MRLQRILLLRELGLGLPAIADVLDRESDEAAALSRHLGWLRQEQERLDRQIRAVQGTIASLRGNKDLMTEQMFDGFDHTQYREEVERRWGTGAYARSDDWWRALSEEERAAWKQRQQQLGADWLDAVARGLAPGSAEAQQLAQRQFDWLRGIPGTPGGGADGPPKLYFTGLADMYVADERFAAHYGGQAGATFVRDAMLAYADRNL